MNHKFKMRQRVTALCMAAMMCCGMLPYEALAEDSTKPIVAATPEQAAHMAKYADGVIVGSAIVKIIAKYGDDAAPYIYDYVKSMKEATMRSVQ